MWLERRLIAYAHQGGAWESPSSTLFAITRAVDAGATGIELDVHATADAELVVCHDATVDRTTAATGNIASFTLAELRELDFSYWFIPGADVTPDRPADDYPYRGRAPEDPRFGIASLRQVLEQFPGVVLNLDIKQTAPVVAPYEESLAQVVGGIRTHRRCDGGLVPRRRHRRLPVIRSRGPDVGRNRGDGGVLAGRTTGKCDSRHSGRGVSGARADGGSGRGRRGFRGRGPPQRKGCPRVDRQRHHGHGALGGNRCGRDHLRPADHPGEGAGRPPTWRGTAAWVERTRKGQEAFSPARSWASCRGWPSSWP